jgi:hypothetical protein
MALLTTAQEYQAVREAIQLLTTTGKSIVTVSIGDANISYQSSQLSLLQAREVELANRICTRNRRKRTTPDFSA